MIAYPNYLDVENLILNLLVVIKMRKGGGKGKGSQFERDVCVALSRLVNPGGDDTIFWRSAMSGGRATVQGRKGIKNKTQLGDITCVHDKGNFLTNYFIVECKFYSKLDTQSFLFSGKGILAQFWRKLNLECTTNDRVPMLIAKQNRMSTLLLVNSPGLKKLATWGHELHPILTAKHIKSFGYVHICWFKELCK